MVSKNKKDIIKKNNKKKCDNCNKELALNNFYNTNSVLSVDGKTNICKKCLKSMIDYNNMETIYKILQLLDIPFIYTYWRTAVESNPNDPWNVYIRIANSKMNEFKTGTWENSKFEPESINPVKLNMDSIIDTISDFEVTSEMVKKWGKQESLEDYYKLESFYQNMEFSNNIESEQDRVYLKKLALISLKMDKALEAGRYDDAKKLGDLFSNYMRDSQFRAIDKTDADKSGGIRRFSDIYAEVEKDGFIPPWEHYRKINGARQDIIDKTIMYLLNFILKFNKVEKLTEPPIDTPKIEEDEIDYDADINAEIRDLELDNYG